MAIYYVLLFYNYFNWREVSLIIYIKTVVEGIHGYFNLMYAKAASL